MSNRDYYETRYKSYRTKYRSYDDNIDDLEDILKDLQRDFSGNISTINSKIDNVIDDMEDGVRYCSSYTTRVNKVLSKKQSGYDHYLSNIENCLENEISSLTSKKSSARNSYYYYVDKYKEACVEDGKEYLTYFIWPL